MGQVVILLSSALRYVDSAVARREDAQGRLQVLRGEGRGGRGEGAGRAGGRQSVLAKVTISFQSIGPLGRCFL